MRHTKRRSRYWIPDRLPNWFPWVLLVTYWAMSTVVMGMFLYCLRSAS